MDELRKESNFATGKERGLGGAKHHGLPCVLTVAQAEAYATGVQDKGAGRRPAVRNADTKERTGARGQVNSALRFCALAQALRF